jgi:TetR/AcrR family transcriptional repressor of nem operon
MPKPSLKDRFMEAGSEELHANGYHATGVAAIAARAGGPKGSFYNHFASKEDLAMDVLGRYAEGRMIHMLTDGPGPPLARIRAHFTHLRTGLAEFDYSRGCMFGNFAAELGGTNPRLAEAVATALDLWVTTLTDAIEQAKTEGDVATSVDAARAARMLVDAWEGAALRAKTAGDPGPLDNVLAFAFTDLLVKERS